MNHFLLDTNVLLWYFWGSERINPVKELIIHEASEVFFSVVSLWEMAIKVRVGKLNIDVNELCLFAKNHAFQELPIHGGHISTYLNLPFLHKDPFDHMLLAQAISSPMRLVTGDSLLAEYSSLVMVI